jgi:WD40 repeat protein
LVGCGDQEGKGIALGTPPPFAIPSAPATATFQPCDSISSPAAVGFLADGRLAVFQGVSAAVGGPGNPSRPAGLVRAWDPATDALQDLFYTDWWDSVLLLGFMHTSYDGQRIYALITGQSPQVYDVDLGVLRPQVAAQSAVSISDDGRFFLDASLVRYTTAGVQDFDFRAQLPAEIQPQSGPAALSSAGNAVAFLASDATTGELITAVAYDDGRLVKLPGGAILLAAQDGVGGLAWSPDDRDLLVTGGDGTGPGGAVQLWEVESASLLASSDGDAMWAVFRPDGSGFVTWLPGKAVERDLTGAQTFSFDHDEGAIAVGPQGRILTSDLNGTSLEVVDHAGVQSSWRQASRPWSRSALAATDDAVLAILVDWDVVNSVDPSYPMMLARFEVGRPGPVAVFQPGEHQSQWQGQVLLSPDERRVAVVFPDSIAVLDATTLAPLARISSSAGAIAWSPDGRYLAATPDLHYRDFDRPPYTPAEEVVIWDASSGEAAARYPVPVYPEMVAFDASGAKLVGWGQPSLGGMPPTDGSVFVLAPPGPVTGYFPQGNPSSFALDTTSGEISATNLPPFVAATRELVATADGVFRISTEERISSFPAPQVASGVFSGDGSLFFGFSTDDTGVSEVRLFGVADGHVVSDGLTGAVPPITAALSHDGRRLAGDWTVYCAISPQP